MGLEKFKSTLIFKTVNNKKMNKIIKTLALSIILAAPMLMHAQPPGNPGGGGTGGAPIDGGIGFLVAGGIALGVKKYKNKNANS